MATKRASKSAKVIPTIKEISTSSMSEYPLNNKLRQPKVFIPLIIIVLAVAAFLLKGFFVAALVNGQPISRLSIIQELEKQRGKQALAAVINQTLILQEAKKKNIEVTQKEIDVQVGEIEESLKKQEQDLDSALAMDGLTRQDFMLQLRLKTMVEKLLGDSIKVTDKEVADYIEKNKETLPTDLKEDEIKKGVTEQLKQQKLGTKSQEWLANLTKNAKINYFVSY